MDAQKLKQFMTAPGPQVTADEHGREPTIWELAFYYYSSHGCEKPKELADEYVAEAARQSRVL